MCVIAFMDVVLIDCVYVHTSCMQVSTDAIMTSGIIEDDVLLIMHFIKFA